MRSRTGAAERFVIIGLGMVNWDEKLADAIRANEQLDFNETAAKIGNLVALEDEILADQSIAGIMALSSLARAVDAYDKAKAEELQLVALSRVRNSFSHILVFALLQIGCFYSKHEELTSAAPYFDEAFRILKSYSQLRKALQQINDNKVIKWMLGIFRMSKLSAVVADAKEVIDSCLRECRGFYIKSENLDAVKEIEAILEMR